MSLWSSTGWWGATPARGGGRTHAQIPTVVAADGGALLQRGESTAALPRYHIQTHDVVRQYTLGDVIVAETEKGSTMTTIWQWIARTLGGSEPFPTEFTAEHLDQAWPLARPMPAHQAVRPTYWQG